MSEQYDPDERFTLDEDPEDVLRKLLNGEDEEEEAVEPAEDEPA